MDIMKELQIEKDIMWNFTDMSTDLFWTRVPYGKKQISLYSAARVHSRGVRDIDLEGEQRKNGLTTSEKIVKT